MEINRRTLPRDRNGETRHYVRPFCSNFEFALFVSGPCFDAVDKQMSVWLVAMSSYKWDAAQKWNNRPRLRMNDSNIRNLSASLASWAISCLFKVLELNTSSGPLTPTCTSNDSSRREPRFLLKHIQKRSRCWSAVDEELCKKVKCKIGSLHKLFIYFLTPELDIPIRLPMPKGMFVVCLLSHACNENG